MSSGEAIPRGTVALVSLDPVRGHEQQGARPCLVVSNPEITGDLKYPLIAVLPITRTAGSGALYPVLAAGSGGLRARSFVLVDQVRSIDKRRVVSVFGRIDTAELERVVEGLGLFLGLLS